MKLMNIIYRIIFIGFCSLAVDVQAEVYKWVDEKGRVHYGDKPPTNQQKNKKPGIDKQVNRLPENNSDRVPVASRSTPFSKNVVLKIRNLFERNKFKKITSILDNYQAKTESNINAEYPLFTAYSAFDFNEKSYQSKFDLWIKNSPDNSHAYLARARFNYSFAWKSRGGKFINKTKKLQLNKMHSYFEKAEFDIAKALTLNRRSMVPYCLLIGIAKSHGDTEKANLTLMQAIKVEPASYIVRVHYMNTLFPRWGGSIAKMQTFAENSMQYYSLNPKLKLLQGFIPMASGDSEYSKGHYQLAGQFYEQATKFGENYKVIFKQGKNEYRQKHYAKALKYFDLSIQLQPEDDAYYHWRSKTLSKLNQNNKAFADSKKAELFNPSDDTLKKSSKRLLSKAMIPGIRRMSKEKASLELAKVEQALTRAPNNSALYYGKATILLSQNKSDDAMKALEKAIELNQHKFEYYQLIDMVLFKRNEFDKILKYWEQYIALYPKDSRGYLERSGTYYHMKRFNLAKKDAKIAMNFGNADAKKIYLKLLASSLN